MKITCTQGEKEQLIQTLVCGAEWVCPLANTEGHWCDGDVTCKRCIETDIEWEIVNDPG